MSVRFTGLLREDGTVLPKDFDEVWNLVKPVDDSSGWLLAGIQQTHDAGLIPPRRPRASPTACSPDRTGPARSSSPFAGRVFTFTVGPLSGAWLVTADGTLATRRRAPCPRTFGSRCRRGRCPRSSPIPTRWSEFVQEDGRRRVRRRAQGPRAHAAVVRRGDVREGRSGPIVGQRVADAGRKLLAFPEYAAQRVAESAGSYARDEAGLIARGADFRQLAGRDRDGIGARRRARRSHRGAGTERSSDPLTNADAEGRPPRAARSHARQVQPAAPLQRPEARAAVPAARRAPQPSDHLDRRAARRGQVHAGRELRRGAQAARRLVPGGSGRRRPGDVLPLPAHGRRRPRRRRRAQGRRGLPVFNAESRGRPPGVHAPVHARVLRAVPARLAPRRRQLPRAQGRSRVALRVRGRPARDSARASTSSSCRASRRRPRWHGWSASSASRASSGKRCASPPRSREALTQRREARSGARPRDPQGERRLGGRHRAHARASRARRRPSAPEALLPEGKEAVFQYFTGEIFGRARPENQRVLMLAALLPTVSASDAEAMSGNPEAALVLDYVYRRHLFTDRRRSGSEPVYSSTRCSASSCSTEGRRRLTSDERQQALDRAAGQLVVARRVRRRRRALHRGAGVEAAGRPHAARGPRAARRRPPQGAHQVARRACRRRCARPSRVSRWAKPTP